MADSPQAAGFGLLLIPGALLCLTAAAIAWQAAQERREGLARRLLLAGCLLGVAGLASNSVRLGWRPATGVSQVVTAAIVVAGLWSVSLCPRYPRLQALAGLAAGLAMVAYLLVPPAVTSGVQAGGAWFVTDELFAILAAGLLLLGSACGALAARQVGVPSAGSASVRYFLPLGLLLQTVALGCRAVGAQLAWGAYWSWDPVDCWRLVAWLVTAISAVGVWRVGWGGRRARVAVTAAALILLLVLAGSLPLVRWLGLASLYLRA